MCRKDVQRYAKCKVKTNVKRKSKKQICSSHIIGNKQGSMTVEAALIVPIMIFVLYALVMLSQLFIVNAQVANGTAQTARYLAKQTAEQDILNHILLRAKFHSYVNANRLWLVDGKESGISFLKSKLPNENEEIEVVANYQCTIKVPLIGKFHFPMETRSVQKAFVGYDPDCGDVRSGERVYVAENGSVYHTNPACSHITITMMTETEAMSMPGVRECKHCKNNIATGSYVTVYGNRMHRNPNCSGLKRTVHVANKDEVHLPICQRCQSH